MHPVSTLDIFQTSVASIKWGKWFMKTGQMITVTGWIHSCLYCIQYSTS